MPMYDLFSKRQQRLNGGAPDVFVYDAMPNELRVQVVMILRDTLGNEEAALSGRIAGTYRYVVETLRREYGVFILPGTHGPANRREYASELFDYILQCRDVERVMDAVELACMAIDVYSRRVDYRYAGDADIKATETLIELNTRFRQHGFGYRYEAGFIMRIDSEFEHAEVVKPALALLHDSRFKGAEDEFHQAHEHFRHGRTREALTSCLASLESTLKSIAVERGWPLPGKPTAKPLFDLMFDQGLIPPFWASHFTGIRTMLESGVPPARNSLASHGQGQEVVVVPAHIAAFALHQTAAAIVFLVTAESELPA